MLRTYVVYFLINLVSAEMGKGAVKTVILESVLKKRKREGEWALAKMQDLEATKKKRLMQKTGSWISIGPSSTQKGV